MSHKDHVLFQSDKGKAMFAAMSNPKFKFRTLIGLVKESKLNAADAQQILNAAIKDDVVFQTQNRFGTPIFCLRDES